MRGNNNAGDGDVFCAKKNGKKLKHKLKDNR